MEQVGTPEEIFRPGHLSKLFQITQGSFEEESQEMELAAVKGTPEVFVIAGNGSGRNTFRRLQREGIPFAAGLLWENDLDYPAARALSSQLFSAPAFEPIPEELLEQAMRCMDGCRKVICCRESFGTRRMLKRGCWHMPKPGACLNGMHKIVIKIYGFL